VYFGADDWRLGWWLRSRLLEQSIRQAMNIYSTDASGFDISRDGTRSGASLRLTFFLVESSRSIEVASMRIHESPKFDSHCDSLEPFMNRDPLLS
jgi:hypothetical protein